MRRIDRIAAALLILFGCIQAFVAAPMMRNAPSQGATLWFIAGGIMLWFAGALNLLSFTDRRRAARQTTLLLNLILLAFAVEFALLGRLLGAPLGVLVIATVVWLTVRAAIAVYSTATAPEDSSASE